MTHFFTPRPSAREADHDYREPADELFECAGAHDPLQCWLLERPLARCADVVVSGYEMKECA